MNRRTFLGSTAAFAATTLFPFPLSARDGKRGYKLGLQLFSVNEDMNRDPLATLREVKAMGYEDFEVYGFDPARGTFYGRPATEFRMMLDDLGLSASSGHFGFSPLLEAGEPDMDRFVDQCIAGAETLGLRYITWPWMAPEQRTLDTFRALPAKLNAIGARVKEAGLGFAYHNHGFEFEDHGGDTGYDLILRETDPDLVKLQMDMYWVMHGGRTTPKALVAAHPGRFVMWHIKDMDKVSRDYTELGNGSIDYRKVLPDPVASGLEFYYLEQGGNFTHSPLRSAADSAEYFQRHLRKRIG
ncbi:sugar phosphate isomerase/epimerase [Lewinella marina]|uniref:Xylose isomerase n=1 Tax=Neolewinella marina TaxID=438751 RepID=A0A2G0CKD7_9BACT|nr:TIM barrel protein [Neolewinella marina]NJB84364.1 sugar phosphate isomerase/epimerase [Neolewinella marina]PHL00437.1 xylose isomerase [Neolewinella marina]